MLSYALAQTQYQKQFAHRVLNLHQILACAPQAPDLDMTTLQIATSVAKFVLEDDVWPKSQAVHVGLMRISPTSHEQHFGTTVIVRNIAASYNHQDVISVLDEEGFRGTYARVTVPWNKYEKRNLGYFFVEFGCLESVARCHEVFEGQFFGRNYSSKRCHVEFAHRQGKFSKARNRRKANQKYVVVSNDLRSTSHTRNCHA